MEIPGRPGRGCGDAGDAAWVREWGERGRVTDAFKSQAQMTELRAVGVLALVVQRQ